MSAPQISLTGAAAPRGLTPGTWAAIVAGLTGAICMLLGPLLPWLVQYPAAWTVPATEWIGFGPGGFLDFIKPAMRVISAGLDYPMDWANTFFSWLPWPVFIAAVQPSGIPNKPLALSSSARLRRRCDGLRPSRNWASLVRTGKS